MFAWLKRLLGRRHGEQPGTFAHGYNITYTSREVKQLKKNLGDRPWHEPSGRGLCPYCLHLEARWRTEGSTIRIRCSQCQRFTVMGTA
ncbi:MAG: hypothetical protein U1E76_26450 [Planctomycetota bacterium]